MTFCDREINCLNQIVASLDRIERGNNLPSLTFIYFILIVICVLLTPWAKLVNRLENEIRRRRGGQFVDVELQDARQPLLNQPRLNISSMEQGL